jgi:hypothetical protein
MSRGMAIPGGHPVGRSGLEIRESGLIVPGESRAIRVSGLLTICSQSRIPWGLTHPHHYPDCGSGQNEETLDLRCFVGIQNSFWSSILSHGGTLIVLLGDAKVDDV